MARHHIKQMLKQQDTTEIVALCDPSQKQLEMSGELFTAEGLPIPTTGPELEPLLQEFKGELDAALIVTPHAFHLKQATACLESGLDVLLEKPMVMNAREARKLARRNVAEHRVRRREFVEPTRRHDLAPELDESRGESVDDRLRATARERPAVDVRGCAERQPEARAGGALERLAIGTISAIHSSASAASSSFFSESLRFCVSR